MEIYHNLFDTWEDVQHCFGMIEPEPDEVLYASYTDEDYSGFAEVYYRRGDKFYYACGSHCSCYGLEGQWEPEQYDNETFMQLLQRQIDLYTSHNISAPAHLHIVIAKAGEQDIT